MVRAKLSAIEFGLQMASEACMKDIEVECDSLSVVQAIQGNCNPPAWECAAVFWSILEHKDGFDNCIFTWIPRSENISAHNLSVWARREKNCPLSWSFEEAFPL